MCTKMRRRRRRLKKAFPAPSEAYSDCIFFEDEMRSGTRSECKRRWTPKGRRPKCRVKLGYEYCYVYAALNPYSGSLFSLLLPDMTKESFCAFTTHFSRYLDEQYGTETNERKRCCSSVMVPVPTKKDYVWKKDFLFKSCRPPHPNLIRWNASLKN